MLNGQTFSSRTGKTSGLPKFELERESVYVRLSNASRHNIYYLLSSIRESTS